MRAARFLERTLLFNFFIHAVAMASMALLLLPATPGGNTTDIVVRAAYIAHHPWLFRLGWFPWQLSALADLLMGIALLTTPWIPRWPARISLLLTIAAIVPDQGGQFLWVTHGVELARSAARSGNFAAYLQFETVTFRYVAAWGCLGYLAGALGWTSCFAAAGTWSRTLTRLSVATWSVFSASTAFIFLPPALRPPAFVAAAGNAVGFILLQLWLLLVTERVLRRSRPDQAFGAWQPWRAPSTTIFSRCAGMIANSRFARALTERIPAPSLISDIHDVVYINYLVEADRLRAYVLAGLELQRLGPAGRWAMLSILTYRNGHFGPERLGRLRFAAPCPVQSNWRLYVTDPNTHRGGVYFITTAITSAAYALAGRLLAENIPMHLLKSGQAIRDPDGTLKIALDPGIGSAPDLQATLAISHDRNLPAPYAECFATYLDFLTYCVQHTYALAPQPWYGRTLTQEFSLGIPLETCIPLTGQVESTAARIIAGDATPLCFTIPSVTFQFDREFYQR